MRRIAWIAGALAFGAALVAAEAQQHVEPSPTASSSKAKLAAEAAATTESRVVSAAKVAALTHVKLGELSTASITSMGAEYRAHEVRLKMPSAVNIVSIETGDVKATLASPRRVVNQERISIPVRGNKITVEARTAVGKAFWTGVGLAGSQPPTTMSFSLAATAACTITVVSDPPGTVVFFNEKRGDRLTNTDTTRDPGTWTVRLSRTGFQDWSDTRELGPRDTWRIVATYPASPPEKP